MAVCLAAAGCTEKETNVYDLGRIQREATESAQAEYTSKFNENVGQVNANQTWNLLANRNVVVAVGGDAAKDYNVYICSGNPALSSDVALMGSAKVKGGSEVKINVTASASKDVLYVMRSDDEYQLIKAAHLNGDSYEVSFSLKDKIAASRRRASAVIPGDPFTFEDTDPYYKSEVPATAKTIDDFRRADWGGQIDENALQGCTEFALADGTYAMHCWMGQRDIYVSGNVTFNVDNSNSLNQARIYLLPGATLNFNMDNYINDLEIYVSSTATLNYNSEFLYNQTGGGKIYNRGTVNFVKDNFEANQNSVVYNEGTISATNITSKPGDGNKSLFYNFGDMVVTGKFELNSCANFYNEGTVNVTGETSVTQQKIYWINKGHYFTGTMIFSAKNCTFYNFCQLVVYGNAHMYDGEFNLMDNSYIVAETGEFDNFIVNMGNNSGFNINGNTNWVAQGDGTYQGFRASGTAYVRLGGTTTVAGHLHTLEMTGDITYAINKIVDLGEGNSGVQPTYVLDNEGVTGAPFASSNFSTTPGECAAVWASGAGLRAPAQAVMYSIAFEDLGSIGDFDFNDIVLYVAHYVAENRATVSLMAAGGELSVDVKYNGNTIFSKNDGKMTNTTGSRGNVIASADVSMTSVADLQKFSIFVKKTNEVSFTIGSANEKGKAPQALIIPGEWQWPTERTNVKTAYPDFVKWVESVTNTDWYEYPVAGKVL